MPKAQPRRPIAEQRRENRLQRHARRADIKTRWWQRKMTNAFVAEATSERTPDVTVAHLLDAGKYAPHEQLLAHVNPAQYEGIILYLLRLIELKEMPYDQYLQTDEWIRKSALAKQHFYGRCALDDSHPAEHTHHRTYVRRGREYGRDLIPLCRSCHDQFHKGGRL